MDFRLKDAVPEVSRTSRSSARGLESRQAAGRPYTGEDV